MRNDKKIMELFTSYKQLEKFIVALVREQVELNIVEKSKSNQIEEEIQLEKLISTNNKYSFRADIFIEKTKFLGNKLIGLGLSNTPLRHDIPTVVEIKKNIGSLNPILNTLNKIKNINFFNVILVSEAVLDKEDRDKLYQAYPNLAIWDGNEIQKLVENNPIIYLKSLNADKIYNNKIVNSISKEDFQIQKENLVKRLKGAIEDPFFSIILGAGVSCSEKAKGWDDLLKEFKIRLSKKLGVTVLSLALEEKVGNSGLVVAQLYREQLSNFEYFDTIYQSIYNWVAIPSRGDTLARAASDLIYKNFKKRNFRVMTYNYDNYIELYLDGRMNYDVVFNMHQNRNDEFLIYHVHGYLPYETRRYKSYDKYEKSIILTEDEYNNLYNDAYAWQIGTQLSFFRENLCLFIGCSLTDPNIRRLLRMVAKEKGNYQTKHFAIINRGKLSGIELHIATNHFFKMGVEVIWTDSHSETKDIVKDLSRL